MKKIVTVLLIVIMGYALSFAQDKTDKFKVGVQFNPFAVANEFDKDFRMDEMSWWARALVRFGLASYLNAEIGAGYGQYTGKEFDFLPSPVKYKTTIIPAAFERIGSLEKRK